MGEDHVKTVSRALAAERRQLTVIFCDLVQSTSLASQLDPEDWRDVVQLYQEACAPVIQRFEGHIAQYLGDGLLVYFGYPLAPADDAQRAVHAGIEILAALQALNPYLQQTWHVRLSVRVGIDTGLVVVGEMAGGARHGPLALGQVPNIAAKIQRFARPDTVVIGTGTHRLVRGYFVCHALGLHTLSGVATPMPLYHVLRVGEARHRLDVTSTAQTPLVGREVEVALLMDRWEQVKAGRGQVVWLSGEPGIGKSRLVQTVKERLTGEPHVRLECRGSPYHQHSLFYPILDVLQPLLHRQPGGAPAQKLRRLERLLTGDNLALLRAVPALTSPLVLSLPDSSAPPLPLQQTQHLLDVLLTTLLDLAIRQPVLFIVAALHWVDPATLAFLELLYDRGRTARIFTLLTSRSTSPPPWKEQDHLLHLVLSGITTSQVESMIDLVAGDQILPRAVRQNIITRSDGIPLFVEELTRMVLESPRLLKDWASHDDLAGGPSPLAIPETLRGLLMAQLDHVGMAKTVAQWGATLGRVFSYALLQAVVPFDKMALQEALDRLLKAELLCQHGVPPRTTYRFRHALIQEAAYDSLLRHTRQQYHHRIATVLQKRWPETAHTQPALLAHHYTEAGLMTYVADF